VTTDLASRNTALNADSAGGQLPSASPWRRLMGIFYEGIILFGVVWFADYAFSALTQFRAEPGPLRTAFQLFTLAVLAVYFTGFWSNGRRSLPMKTLSMQLRTESGKPPSAGRALARFAAATAMWLAALAAGYYLSAWLYLLVLLPYVWVLIDRDRRALYDLACGTRLVTETSVASNR
jgi:uncharacterized RDD family membrane protein YckC